MRSFRPRSRFGASLLLMVWPIAACSSDESSQPAATPDASAGATNVAGASGAAGAGGTTTGGAGGTSTSGGAGTGGVAGTGGTSTLDAGNDARATCIDSASHSSAGLDCSAYCAAFSAPGCSGGPTQSECNALCPRLATVCSGRLDAVIDCTGATPTFECNARNDAVVAGCEDVLDCLGACIADELLRDGGATDGG